MKEKNFVVKLSSQHSNKYNDVLLIAFPFSGATAQSFVGWRQYIPDSVDFSAVQYPGRGHLIHEKPLFDLEQLLSNLYQPLLAAIREYKYVIWYGHSLGGLVAYELIKKYSIDRINLPTMKLVIGACPSPELIGKKPHLHTLSNDKFWEKIKQYGGTPESIIDDKDFKALFLPILKADFTMYESYKFRDKESILNLPLVVIGGDDDHVVSYDELTGWKNLTNNLYQQFHVEGDHFFLNYNSTALISKIIGLNEQYSFMP